MATGNTLMVLWPQHNEPPGSNAASANTRNSIAILEFDAATIESAIFRDVIPSHYTDGGLTVDVYWMAASAVAGDVKWGASVERNNANNHDLDADAFASEQTAVGTANATPGKLTKTSIALTSGANMDGAAATDPIRVKIRRVASDGADSMTGDAHLHSIHVRET